MSTHTLVGGQVLSGVHEPDKCIGEFCTIHNPSRHSMRNWRQIFIRGVMYRQSPEGALYPDPDDPRKPEQPNAIVCRGCGALLVSFHRHDYRTCDCPNKCMVDGGYEYARRGWAAGRNPDDCFEEVVQWPIYPPVS